MQLDSENRLSAPNSAAPSVHAEPAHPSSAAPPLNSAADEAPRRRTTLAVIGDIHEQWDTHSAAALASLNPDAVIVLGDIGNEDVELVAQVASVPHSKAVVLGNHDAFYTMTARGRQRAVRMALMSSSLKGMAPPGEAVRTMLSTLGSDHIGFGAKHFEELGVAVVGGRPFSKGGKQWSDVASFYNEYCGIGSMQESAHRIVDVALSQPPEATLIVAAHNGPTGLGGRRYSPCGVDWQQPEEDFGDPDLQEALEVIAGQGRPAALVLFGHMHNTLKGGGRRDMAHVDPGTGTVYLNSAFVPRIQRFPVDWAAEKVRGHHFLLVEIEGGAVVAARHVFAASPEELRELGIANGSSTGAGDSPVILAEQEVLKTAVAPDGNDALVMSYFKAYSAEWVPVVVKSKATAHAT